MNMKIFLITTTIFHNSDWEVLIVKRNNEPYKWFWSLPWGKLEFWEKIYDWNKREILEELWYEIKNNNFFKIFEFFDIGHAIVFCYEEKINDKKIFLDSLVKSEKEIAEVKWEKISNLERKDFFPNHLDVINNYFSNN